jgi:Fe-S-cluster-containing dehydrogenase component
LCDLCVARTKHGELPACVEQCTIHCIRFGPLDDLAREVAQTPSAVLFRPR